MKMPTTKTHGMSNTKLYKVWASMKERCSRKKHKQFKNYGGRGIIVCDEWLKFEPFCQWALKNGYSVGLWIDRIDNDGNYSPENCRFVSINEQAVNKRTNRYLIVNGEKKSVSEWARKLNIKPRVIYERLNRGFSNAEALTTINLRYLEHKRLEPPR